MIQNFGDLRNDQPGAEHLSGLIGRSLTATGETAALKQSSCIDHQEGKPAENTAQAMG